MPIKTKDWNAGAHVGGYSVVIDVRTPAEFEEDHIPGAINLPVLDHDQRHEVGLTYKNNSFEGRKLGASLIASSISSIIQTHFMDKDQTYKPLVYCWRGGKRSGSLALVLEQIGFQASVLDGGYKGYRAQVQGNLANIPPTIEWRVLTGPTGSGKTEVLYHMDAHGHQVLDLEGLAKHRGSVLGSWDEAQPGQKLFESLLSAKLQTFDVTKPVWVEDEASVIGKIHVPKVLFESVMPAPRYEICLPLDQRIKHLMTEYKHMVDNPEVLKSLLDRLVRQQGHERIKLWHDLIDKGHIEELVHELLAQHYDPANARSIKARLAKYEPVYERIDISRLESDTLLAELPAHMFLPKCEQASKADPTTAAAEQHWFHQTANTGFNADAPGLSEGSSPHARRDREAQRQRQEQARAGGDKDTSRHAGQKIEALGRKMAAGEQEVCGPDAGCGGGDGESSRVGALSGDSLDMSAVATSLKQTTASSKMTNAV